MLIELSTTALETNLVTRKLRFNKCRIVNGKITLADLVKKKKIDTVEKKTIELKPILETPEEKKSNATETTKESKVVKLETSPVEVKTYNQQFKGGYFGRRKRF